jgi:iron complex outermembrane receptor protein
VEYWGKIVKRILFVSALLSSGSYATLAASQDSQNSRKLPPVTVTADGQLKNVQQNGKKNARGRAVRRSRQAAPQNQQPAQHQQQQAAGVLAPQNQILSTAPRPAGASSVTQNGIAILGGPAQTSFYQALTMVPSVLVESPDPYGLSPTRNISIRGKGDFHLSKNIEGLPLAGIVGGTDLYDLENIRRIDVYRGAVPSDQGLGLSNASGVINQFILGPQDKAGVTGRQAFGSDNFYKTFLRVDTGLLKDTGTRAFISGSNAQTDKWKGAGDIERQNLTFGINQAIGERITVDLNAVYNKFDGNTYRGLSYAQAQDISRNYKFDYNTALTGVPATDVNYYKFNRVTAENFAVLGKVDYNFAPGQHLLIKPYFWNNNGYNYSAAGNQVQIWRQQNQNIGNVFEYTGRFATGTDVVAGYWWQSMQPPPPPTDQRRFTVNAGNLVFANWQSLARIDDFTVNSPYFQVSQKFGDTFVTAGVRYMILGGPKMQYYNTAGIPNGSYDQALATNPALYPDATVQARDYTAWLPNIAVRQDLNSVLSANVSYGRRFGRPDWGPQASNYISNRTAFLGKGYTLQTLVDKVRPEIADQFDASLRYSNNGLTIVPGVFYAKHQNKQVKIIDPTIGANIAYYQGTGSSTEYGAELEASYALNTYLAVFGTGTWASETFDSDTPTLSGGATLATKGKQIPNTPQVMLKGGVTYQWAGLSVSPIVRYIGPRYGDAANTQRVPGYTVADVTASYDLGTHLGIESVKASISVLNIFDRRYISEISPNDTDLSAGANYYAGAPRTVVGSLSMKF